MKWWKKYIIDRRADAGEADKIDRLVKAEGDLRDLQQRGDAAVKFLLSRTDRNHWHEAIENLIQGASR